MAKTQDPERTEVARARLCYARVAPRKLRLVADLIRGKTVVEARNILKFTVKPSSVPHLVRLLKSVVANAHQGGATDTDSLLIGEIQVDGGPMWKRWRPRAYGRAGRIRKRLSHISITLTE